MAKRRRPSLRELERRLVRAMTARGSAFEACEMAQRMRRYAVMRRFCAHTALEGVARQDVARQMDQADIESAIRDVARKGMGR